MERGRRSSRRMARAIELQERCHVGRHKARGLFGVVQDAIGSDDATRDVIDYTFLVPVAPTQTHSTPVILFAHLPLTSRLLESEAAPKIWITPR